MATAKQAVRDLLEQLPDDCSLEDVQYELYLRQKLEKSRLAASEGRVVRAITIIDGRLITASDGDRWQLPTGERVCA